MYFRFVSLAIVTLLLTGPFEIFLMQPALSQEKLPFAKIAELAVRKGYENVWLTALCHHFGLAGRVDDGACQGFQLSSRIDEVDERKYGIAKNTKMTFDSFVEKGTGIRRIVISERDTQAAHAFLTNRRGQLLKAMMGPNVAGDFRWHLIEITSEIKSRFSRVASYWIGSLTEIEQLPDR